MISKVAMSLGKIIRRPRARCERRQDEQVAECADVTDAACLALKRCGKSLDASIDISAVECSFACVVIY